MCERRSAHTHAPHRSVCCLAVCGRGFVALGALLELRASSPSSPSPPLPPPPLSPLLPPASVVVVITTVDASINRAAQTSTTRARRALLHLCAPSAPPPIDRSRAQSPFRIRTASAIASAAAAARQPQAIKRETERTTRELREQSSARAHHN